MRDVRVTVSAGRALSFTDIGAPDWPCLFFFHGAPSSRLRLAYLEAEFLDAKIRVVSPDRPGYGASSPQPDRSIADWPSDVAALADSLQVRRIAVAGHSSGGPYALACAAALPALVSTCIILGGVTDFAWPGAWEGYIGLEQGLMRLPDLASVLETCESAFGADGSRFMSAAAFELPEPDARLYADEATARLLTASRAEAFRQGVLGYAQDVFLQGRPWPFSPDTISVPVHVLHGEADTLLPLAHSRHTAKVVPGSLLRVVRGHGHFSILAQLPALARALAS